MSSVLDIEAKREEAQPASSEKVVTSMASSLALPPLPLSSLFFAARPEPALAEQIWQEGLAAEQQEEFSRARHLYQQAAEKGSASALVSLGMFAWKGKEGEAKNASMACHYFRQAANRGDPEGTYHLAYLLETGEAVDPGKTPREMRKQALAYYLHLGRDASTPEAVRNKVKERFKIMRQGYGVLCVPPPR